MHSIGIVLLAGLLLNMTNLSAADLSAELTFDSCLPYPCSLKEPWRTVDLFPDQLNQHGNVSGIASFEKYSYSVGDTFIAGKRAWVVRRSSDQGETWQYVDQVLDGIATGVAVNPLNGEVYVVGTIGNPNSGASQAFWLVRKSSDHGNTWQNADEIQPNGSKFNPIPSRVAIDKKGRIIVIGHHSPLGPAIMRQSEDGGATWNTIHFAGPMTYSTAIVVAPTGAVFVAGVSVSHSHSPMVWVVRYSQDGISNWATVDQFKTHSSSAASSFPYHGAIHDDGRVVFVGRANDGVNSSNALNHWIVRSASITTPQVWTTLLDRTILTSQGSTQAHSVTFSKYGEIFVTGVEYKTGALESQRITLRGNPPSKPFTQSDLVVMTGALAGISLPPLITGTGAMARTDKGDILAGGRDFKIADSRTNWLVRKLKCKFLGIFKEGTSQYSEQSEDELIDCPE